jgi:hypothetical protein
MITINHGCPRETLSEWEQRQLNGLLDPAAEAWHVPRPG